MKNQTKKIVRLGLVVPHIFIHQEILPNVIFSPGRLAIDLAEALKEKGTEVTFFSPGPVKVDTHNITADLSYFENELKLRGDDYISLLKKHPFTFVTLARQVQAELVAKAYAMANADELDIVHIYTNEEDIALPFAQLCNKPVVFTHHDPFNFLIKYKNVFPKYKSLNWISTSLAQRKTMPKDTDWLANIYHGFNPKSFTPNYQLDSDYIAYLGRIIEPKGVHLAIAAIKQYNKTHDTHLKLKIAGKHYADHKGNSYWESHIEPQLDSSIIYVGFIDNDKDKNDFLVNARALMIPSLFEEPFGMVMIEALACGTPIIGLDSGAIPEIIENDKNGILVSKCNTEAQTIENLAIAIEKVTSIDRKTCRDDFENRFSLDRMCEDHLIAYKSLI